MIMPKNLQGQAIKVGDFVEVIDDGGFESNKKCMGMLWEVTGIKNNKVVHVYNKFLDQADTLLVDRLFVVPTEFMQKADPLNLHKIPIEELHGRVQILIRKRDRYAKYFVNEPTKKEITKYFFQTNHQSLSGSIPSNEVWIKDIDDIIATVEVEIVKEQQVIIAEGGSPDDNYWFVSSRRTSKTQIARDKIMHFEAFLERLKDIKRFMPINPEWVQSAQAEGQGELHAGEVVRLSSNGSIGIGVTDEPARRLRVSEAQSRRPPTRRDYIGVADISHVAQEEAIPVVDIHEVHPDAPYIIVNVRDWASNFTPYGMHEWVENRPRGLPDWIISENIEADLDYFGEKVGVLQSIPASQRNLHHTTKIIFYGKVIGFLRTMRDTTTSNRERTNVRLWADNIPIDLMREWVNENHSQLPMGVVVTNRQDALRYFANRITEMLLLASASRVSDVSTDLMINFFRKVRDIIRAMPVNAEQAVVSPSRTGRTNNADISFSNWVNQGFAFDWYASNRLDNFSIPHHVIIGDIDEAMGLVLEKLNSSSRMGLSTAIDAYTLIYGMLLRLSQYGNLRRIENRNPVVFSDFICSDEGRNWALLDTEEDLPSHVFIGNIDTAINNSVRLNKGIRVLQIYKSNPMLLQRRKLGYILNRLSPFNVIKSPYEWIESSIDGYTSNRTLAIPRGTIMGNLNFIMYVKALLSYGQRSFASSTNIRAVCSQVLEFFEQNTVDTRVSVVAERLLGEYNNRTLPF